MENISVGFMPSLDDDKPTLYRRGLQQYFLNFELFICNYLISKSHDVIVLVKIRYECTLEKFYRHLHGQTVGGAAHNGQSSISLLDHMTGGLLTHSRVPPQLRMTNCEAARNT